MLTKLDIENVALVDKLTVDFTKGLNVVTGETGAGKSVMISALSLALGARADKDTIRHGCDSAKVRLTIDLSRAPKHIVRELADAASNDTLTIERVVSRDGESRIRIGDVSTTVNRLRETIAPVAQLLGQHAGQRLLDESYHIAFLDAFGGLVTRADQTEAAYFAWQKTAQELKSLVSRRQRINEERELLLFQKHDIESASLQIGEEESLQQERKVLDSARVLMDSATKITNVLSGEDRGVRDLLALASRELQKSASVDPTLKDQALSLESIALQIDDLNRDMERYGSSIQDNPERIEEVNQRLETIYRLKKKYGGSERAVVEYLQETHKKLSEAENIDDAIASLEQTETKLCDSYSELARDLSERREKAAGQLSKAVIRELKQLAIEGARFECEFVRQSSADGIALGGTRVTPLPRGLETVRFLFSANSGEPHKPLVKTASGGELSRVLLALTASQIEKDKSAPLVLVLDEIDVGIGGQTGHAIAERLKSLAAHSQLVVITHLHQIARLADSHIAVSKHADNSGRSVIAIKTLSSRDAKKELDRMIALTRD